jgi:GTP-binding protein
MLDKVKLSIKAGDGGRGAVTFRREKFIPFGGPYGGDGGKGGDVIIAASASVSTLRAFLHKRIFKAESGQNGMTKNKHGKDGANLVIQVPGDPGFQQSETGRGGPDRRFGKDGEQVLAAPGWQGRVG